MTARGVQRGVRAHLDRGRTFAPAILLWLPVVLGGAYLILLAVRFPHLIERVYWDSDAATAAVIAETAGHGTIVLERFGWFTAFPFALLTKPLPLHRHIWEVAPYLFSLCSVSLLAWASLRLAGRWAAAMTATAAVATSPFVTYDLVTLNFHTGTWVPTVVLGVYCLWLARAPPRHHAVVTAVLVAGLAGLTLASDTLFLASGLVPFALMGVLLLRLPAMRSNGGLVLGAAAAALPIALLATWTMSLVGVEVTKRGGTHFAQANGFWPNFGNLLRQILQLANGDYFIDSDISARSLLSFACALVMLAGVAAPFVMARRELRSPSPSTQRLVYASFWATSLLLVSSVYVLSSEGEHGGFYLIPILYAVAGTAPVVASGSAVGRAAVAIGIALVATASFVNLADTNTALLGDLPPAESRVGLPPLSSAADRIEEIAANEGAQYGYADYWDASSLTWNTELELRVQPVSQCFLPESRALCAYPFNVNTRWFDADSPKSFVLRNLDSHAMREEPPDELGPPSAVHPIDDMFTMYVYPYDVATRLDYSYASWRD
jgi:hypothetical protein